MKKYNTNLFGQKLNVSQAIDSNAEGKGTITRNIGENANGTFNVSNTGSEDSKKTIHSIGIGTKDSDRSNALEIMQNGDIYLYGVGGYEGDNASDSKSIQSIIQDSQSGGDYTLPIASADTLGGIKVGEGLNIDGEGVLSSTGSGVGKIDNQLEAEGVIVYSEIFNVYDDSEYKNTASGAGSHVEGAANKVLGNFSHCEGIQNTVEGNFSHCEGSDTSVKGNYAHSEGLQNIADGEGSHSEGLNNSSIGRCSHTEGRYTTANNDFEHAQGISNMSNKGSEPQDQTIHSIGIGVMSTPKNAQEVMTNGDHYIYGIGGYDGTNYSEAQTLQEVVNSLSSGSGSGVGKVDETSDGTGEIFNIYDGEYKNVASGEGSHAEGGGTQALGQGAHAEGSTTIAEGMCSHSEGQATHSKGDASHSEGASTIANGTGSHTEGGFTIANNNAEHAEGMFNKSNSGETPADKTRHSIGIGTSDSDRKNAVEVMQNGDHYIIGIGGYDGTNYSSAQTLQEVVSNIQNTIWIGTQTQYDQLESKNENTLYFITE